MHFFPQFIDPVKPVMPQIIVMGGTFILIEIGAIGLYAFGGRWLQERFEDGQSSRWLSRFTAVALTRCRGVDSRPMKQLSNYAYGTVLMILGVLVLSPDSGLLRLIDGDPYVVSFWRGMGICLVLWAAALVRSPAEFVYQLTHHTAVSVGIVLSFGMSSMSFVFGVTLLGAPTMLVFVALTPLASAFARSHSVRRIDRPRVMDCDRNRNHWRIDFGFRDP